MYATSRIKIQAYLINLEIDRKCYFHVLKQRIEIYNLNGICHRSMSLQRNSKNVIGITVTLLRALHIKIHLNILKCRRDDKIKKNV